MANQQQPLDALFHALSDPTRRAVLQRLGEGSASVKDLSGPFSMALPSFLKHLAVLEDSGLITTQKSGRTRTCNLNKAAFAPVDDWLSSQKAMWTARTDRLAAFVEAKATQEEDRNV